VQIRLIDDWKRAWRWGSVRLGFLASTAVAYLVANPNALNDLVSYVPEHWRPLAAPLIGLLSFAIIASMRVTTVVKNGS
jgi:hypothetical protein